jgi:hypothetical protein
MAGFITGYLCFAKLPIHYHDNGGQRGFFVIKVNKSRNKAGVGVQLVFQVSPQIRDQELLKSFVSYFNCGQYINSLQKE